MRTNWDKLKKISSFILLSLISIALFAQEEKPEDTEIWDPEPVKITAGINMGAPSDAIILLSESDSSEWVNSEGLPMKWDFENGIITVTKGGGSIYTRKTFASCQLHIEWRSPAEVESEGQGRGNSGIFFQSKYEVQVLDSYNNRTYSNGQAASLYKQHIPLVNASRKPGEWQEYDIVFMAPEFDEGGLKIKSGSLTVFHNGVLVQNNIEILGTTEYIGLPKNEAHGREALMLQDHGNPVSYRNIWIREL